MRSLAKSTKDAFGRPGTWLTTLALCAGAAAGCGTSNAYHVVGGPGTAAIATSRQVGPTSASTGTSTASEPPANGTPGVSALDSQTLTELDNELSQLDNSLNQASSDLGNP